ncbi:4Fe-4S dicluster domain-containing protein [Candidatus Microgenomates bacterium]|jgi:MinD superfamily P-loop ATPase|nr:MAG: 4Fe-4S dicluster domain-containing protein [Candidatus Microgenomates bacterium]
MKTETKRTLKIAVTGGKGGVGKSMVATSLAVELAERKKTMLVDADAECPNDHLLLSVEREKISDVYQAIPKWDFSKCVKCGRCALACKQEAIVFVKGRFPAFVKESCLGCMACQVACPWGAISADKKEIGTIYSGKNYGVNLVSGELKLGELASGEVVSEVRKRADELNKKAGAEVMVIDSSPGVGCPVIASLVGTDYIVAVTEPTPSALFDLKRVLYLAEHFKIERGIVINKCDLAESFLKEIEVFAEEKKIPIIGKIPYRKDFLESTIKQKPIKEINPNYKKLFCEIIDKIEVDRL